MLVEGVKLYRHVSVNGKRYTGSQDKRSRSTRYIIDLFPQGWFAEKTILDIGSAGGAISFAAAELGADYVMGVDVRKERVAAATRIAIENKIDNVTFICDNIHDLPVGGKYDCIFLLNILHHEKDPRILLRTCITTECTYLCVEHPKRGYFSTNNAHAYSHETVVMDWKEIKEYLRAAGYVLEKKCKSTAEHTKGKRIVGLFKRV